MANCTQFEANDFVRDYHAHEWGEPVQEAIILFEYLVLHVFQAALPLDWVLRRRVGFQEALFNFDPDRLARFTDDNVAEFLLNPRVLRNRRKLEATVRNAQAWLRLRAEVGGEAGLLRFFYGFVGGRPRQNRWATAAQVPVTDPAGDDLSRELKKRGFTMIGPINGYSLLQTAGLVNDHLLSCPRHAECAQLAAEWAPDW